jgi:hypothetical protein
MTRALTSFDLDRPSHQRLVIALFLAIVFPLSLVLGVGVFFALL